MVNEIKNYVPRQLTLHEIKTVARYKAIWHWQLTKLNKLQTKEAQNANPRN